jgi:hypothetical protein
MNKPLRINASRDRLFSELSDAVSNSECILLVDANARYRALVGLMVNFL